MSAITQPNDSLNFMDEDKPKLNTGLNVLTILTFIGCALGLIGGFWQFFTAEKSYRDMMKMRDKLDELPAFVRKMMTPEAFETARKNMEYKLPILLITLVGVALCFYGALEMRKLKKQGFILWVAGEFLPFVAMFLFVGSGMFAGFAIFFYIIPIAFLIMYAVNRKNLVY